MRCPKLLRTEHKSERQQDFLGSYRLLAKTNPSWHGRYPATKADKCMCELSEQFYPLLTALYLNRIPFRELFSVNNLCRTTIRDQRGQPTSLAETVPV